MKILLLVPLWKRPEIVRLFIYRMEAVIPDYAEIMPLFILSPFDPHVLTLEKFTDGYNRFYYSNEYLGDKLNAGMTYAMNYEWDYLMGLGSDNIYTPALWDLYEDLFADKEPYFAINDFHVLDLPNNRAWYMRKYIDDPALGGIGAGRVIHRSLLEEDPCIYRPGTNQGMDGFSAYELFRRGYTQKIVETGGAPVMLDIKTRTNVNQPEELYDQREKDVPVDQVKEWFGLYDAEILDSGAFDLIHFDTFHREVCKLSQDIPQRDAFNTVNVRYEMSFGEKRYKNLESYQVQVTKKFKRNV
jgi:hypothetical protein